MNAIEKYKEQLQNVTALFRTKFNAGLTNPDREIYHKRIATPAPSKTSKNTYGMMGSIPSLRKWIGDRVIHNLSKSKYSIVNEDFELTIGVERNDIKDDELGLLPEAFKQMGESVLTHPDEMIFELLSDGFDKECYDGQNFFDTDHPVTDKKGNEQSVSNMQDGVLPAWFLLDTTRPLKPLIYQEREKFNMVALDNQTDPNVFHKKQLLYGVDGRDAAGYCLWQLAYGSKAELNATNFKAARKAMQTLQGDNGKKLGIKANLLVVGPSNEDAATDLLKKESLANGESNTLRGAVELVVVPYLD